MHIMMYKSPLEIQKYYVLYLSLKRLAVIQAALKKQLQAGGQTIYGNQHPNGTAGVEKDWKNTVRNHVRGK
jgi:hypothetical protein